MKDEKEEPVCRLRQFAQVVRPDGGKDRSVTGNVPWT